MCFLYFWNCTFSNFRALCLWEHLPIWFLWLQDWWHLSSVVLHDVIRFWLLPFHEKKIIILPVLNIFFLIAQWASKLKKVQTKKLVKSISQKRFLQFQKCMSKNNFWTVLKLPKMQFHEKKYYFFISRVFLAALF